MRQRRIDLVIKEAVPEGSFLHTYLQMMEPQETPLQYDMWCGLWCLSNAVTRWAVVDRPRAPVRLNMYVILVAESGVTRKSTAVNMAVSIMRRFIERVHAPIELINTKTTPERLEQVLQERSIRYGHAHFAFGVSELVTALGSERYNLAMPGLLTDLYDSPAERKSTGTISRGGTEASRIYGTFLSASTPSWLLRAINPDVIEGGFTSRCYFVVAEQRKQVSAWPTSHETDFEADLVDKLCTVYNAFAPKTFKELEYEKRINLEAPALSFFKEWYANRTHDVDPYLSSFEAREDSHVLRIAALLAINAGRNRISDREIQHAVHIIQDVKLRGGELLSYGVSNELVQVIEKVRTLLLTGGPSGTRHTDVVIKLNPVCKAKRLSVILNIMHRLEMVRRFEYTEGKGRPGTIWMATDRLKSAEFLKMMLEELEAQGQ